MKTSAMVVGIIGAVIALFVGLMGFTCGQIVKETGDSSGGLLQVLSLSIPVIAFIGAISVKEKTEIGSVLLLISGAVPLFIFGIHLISLVSGIPLILAGIFGFLSITEKKP